MSNEKFTPGEWRVEITDHELADTGDYITDFAVATEKTGVAQCFDNSVVSEEEAAANCHLIAAAPEMYEFISWIGSVEGQCAILTKDPEIVRKAHAILKKARGEE